MEHPIIFKELIYQILLFLNNYIILLASFLAFLRYTYNIRYSISNYNPI